MVDPWVSEELVAQAATHQRFVRHLARQWGPSLAEELASEAMARAVMAWRRGSLRAPVAPWLRAVVVNVGTDVLRRERVASKEHSGLGFPYASRDDTDTLLDVLVVREAVRMLAPASRRLIVLRYWGELALDEIAEVTGMSERAVRDSLYRSRRRLARHLTLVGCCWRHNNAEISGPTT